MGGACIHGWVGDSNRHSFRPCTSYERISIRSTKDASGSGNAHFFWPSAAKATKHPAYGETALAVVFLTGAGLLLRSFVNVLRCRLGLRCSAVPHCTNAAKLQRAPRENFCVSWNRFYRECMLCPAWKWPVSPAIFRCRIFALNSAILPGDGPLPPREQWQTSCGNQYHTGITFGPRVRGS